MENNKINSATVPQRKLNNGMMIPGIGMVTFGNDKFTSEQVADAVPFSIYENEYFGNLKCTTEDFLTDEEMETLAKADKNFRLIKGKVFLWEDAKDWRDIWDNEE